MDLLDNYMARINRNHRQDREVDLGAVHTAASGDHSANISSQSHQTQGPQPCDWPVTDPTSTRDPDEPPPPSFTVTTGSDSESEGDTEDDRTMRAMRTANSRLFAPSDESESEEVVASWNITSRPYANSSRFPRPARRDEPSRIEAHEGLVEAMAERRLGPGSATVTPGELSRSDGGNTPGPLLPHARFFIEKHRSRITVRFDPPV